MAISLICCFRRHTAPRIYSFLFPCDRWIAPITKLRGIMSSWIWTIKYTPFMSRRGAILPATAWRRRWRINGCQWRPSAVTTAIIAGQDTGWDRVGCWAVDVGASWGTEHSDASQTPSKRQPCIGDLLWSLVFGVRGKKNQKNIKEF